MSARSWSGHPPRGGGRLEERPLAGVPGQEPPLVADAQGCVRELVHEDGTADVVHAVAAGRELKPEPLEAHGVSLRTRRSCWRESRRRRSTPARRTNALAGCAGLTVKRRLKSGRKVVVRYVLAAA